MLVSRVKSVALMLLGALLWSSEAVAQQRPRLLVPVSHACISSPFGPRVLPDYPQAGTFHYGIDLPAPEGAPVRAAGPGVLLRVRREGPGGLELIVQHGGFVGVYSHLGVLDPKMEIGGNVRIRGGEQLGVVGRTGMSLGPHLYFGILQNGRAVDPAHLLGISFCNGGRSPGSAKIQPASEAPPGMAAPDDEPLPLPRSTLLDDFPPTRGCDIGAMVAVSSRQANVERGGTHFGRTGVTKYSCPLLR
jgi:murein DD-endopeptidase MepM/ murein hydrolase activator NlpD